MQYIHLIYPYQRFSSLIPHAFMLSLSVMSNFLQSFWTVACQAPLSMGFFRWEYWSELPFPSPGDLPDPGIEPRSPALQAHDLPTELWGQPLGSMDILTILISSNPWTWNLFHLFMSSSVLSSMCYSFQCTDLSSPWLILFLSILFFLMLL